MGLTTIVSTRRDVDSPWKENLFTDLHSRDDELREAPFNYAFAEFSTTSAFPTYVVAETKNVYIPTWARGITMAAQFAHTTGDSVFFEWFLDGSSVAAAAFENASVHPTYDDTHRKTLAAIPTAIRGTRVVLELKISAGGGGTAYAKGTDGAACRFE